MISSQCRISIHSPVWGETIAVAYQKNVKKISIHSPVWGETTDISLLTILDKNFNPLARMGRDIG
ncbi:hypothetical protein M837_01917 [Streptococcus equi subsp. zooepidemicus SzS31A1]|uniref:Uncharacterized protein n=1 Tax=Streptococcus equi subsp. zooepidemicus SzS31A1 TaxID=1352602 RepID=A0ABR4RSW8_STRSZ|nr:hypothetical protein M837_01917 [Streptococcus equi subsp. zooepidemicus SzS31A1]